MRASVSFAIIFGVVPLEISEWNPEMAPHMMQMKQNGKIFPANIGPLPSVKRVNGSMRVTDGPFIESKETVGGFALIEVEDLDRAIAIAKSWPGGDVEVRPIVVH